MTTTDNRIGHTRSDIHGTVAGPVSSNRSGHDTSATHTTRAAAATTSLQAIPVPSTSEFVPAGTTLPADHSGRADTHGGYVGGTNSSPPANDASAPRYSPLEGNQAEDGSAATIDLARSIQLASLADPFLALAADVLDDTEATKIANENRLRQLTRTAVDSDGEERGFGLDESHPDVANLAALVALLGQVEHQAVLQLQRKMRKHPLGPWIKSQKGVGDKQAARLLAVIGDPYWNDLHNRPRTVSELWAYSGLHVLPASHTPTDAQRRAAGGDSSPAGGDSSQKDTAAQMRSAGVAARRQKGQKANWSTLAKTRAYLIAESMLRAGNREVYDKRKAATEGRLHSSPCVRCGPKGKPALVGSPWSDGHRHADALRIQSKELLKGLWREAKRLHEEH
jgi:hypothetical protein